MTFGAVFQRPFPPVFDRGLDAAAAAAGWWVVAGKTCVAAYQPKGAASLADVALPSWAQAHLGVDVTEANIAAARLWVDYDTLRRRLAAGYNSAAALVDAGLAAGALPAWADVVAVIEAA